MSDTQQGPGWWQATDGRWYPPEQHPNYVAPVAPPPPPPPPGVQGYTQPPAAYGAPIAPTAGQPKKNRGCLTAGLVAAGILVVLVIVGAVLGGGDDDSTEAEGGGTTTAVASPESGDPVPTVPTTEAPGAKPAADAGTRENPLPAGQAHDIGDGWTVKVAGYNPEGNALVEAANMFNEDPAPGQQYVVVQIDATNTGSETRSPFDLTFELLGSAGVTLPLSLAGCVAPEPQWSSLGEAYPNATLSGFLCALVPSEQVPSLVLIAEPTFAFSGNKTFMALS